MFNLKQGKIAGWGVLSVGVVTLLIAGGLEPNDFFYTVYGIAIVAFLPWAGIMLIKNSK